MADLNAPSGFLSKLARLTREHPLLASLAVLALIGIGGVVAYIATATTGDEPPIRVKGGSIELELLSGAAFAPQWGMNGDAQHWKIAGWFGAKRKHSAYQVLVTYTGAACTSGGYASDDTVTLTYSNEGTVQLKATGNHTTVTVDDPARKRGAKIDPNSGDMRLVFPDTGEDHGYISKIQVGQGAQQKTLCDFDNATTTLTGMALLDW